jgi:tryptophan halogenase
MRGTDNPPLLQENTASPAGWQWSVPGASRGERGYAWCSGYQDEQGAAAMLQAANAAIAATASAAPPAATRALRLQRGRPRQFWLKNCVALTAGAIAPQDDLRLHLAHAAIARLLALFPADALSLPDANEYNRLTNAEHERARDFTILHYRHGPNRDEPFWNHCRNTPPPESLAALLELFVATGRLATADDDFVSTQRWLSVLLGQGVMPQSYDPVADTVDAEVAASSLARLASEIDKEVATLPTHGAFLRALHADAQA